jgi:hypothetical protein
MTKLLIGNSAPVGTVSHYDADGVETKIRTAMPHLGNQITEVDLPDGADQAEAAKLALSTGNDRTLLRIAKDLKPAEHKYALALRDLEDLWAHHSDEDADWVESDDEAFAAVVARYFTIGDNTCVVGRPAGWTTTADDQVAGGGIFNIDEIVGKVHEHHDDAIFSPEWRAQWREHNLITNAGRDAMHAQRFSTSAQPAAFTFMAVTANSSAALAADTVLTGEITTAGGGLLRGAVTYAHTTGTNITTLTRTLTANGSDSLPVVIAKIGVFNAAAVGTMGLETLLNATSTLNIAGDNVTITDTYTE